MRRIDVQCIRQRKGNGVMHRLVRRRVKCGDWLVCQTRKELLDPTKTHHATDRRSKCIIVPVLQVQSIIEALPFFLCEEFTKLGIAECDCLLYTGVSS
jgi:hypothetical protein